MKIKEFDRRWYVLIIPIVLISAIIIIFSWMLSYIFGASIFDWAIVFQAGGSVGLSAALAYLYLSMRDIQESQEKLERKSQQPILRVDSIEPIFQITEKGDYFGSSYYIMKISNVGNGAAVNIELRLTGECPGSEIEIKETKHKLRRVSCEEGVIIPSDSHLDPGSKNIPLEASAAMKVAPPCEQAGSETVFEAVTQELSQEGGEILELCMELYYVDSLEDSHTREFLTYLLPLKGRTSIETAFANGYPADAPRARRRTMGNRNEMENNTAGDWRFYPS